MAGGARSLLAFWVGGASAAPTVTQGGFRTPLPSFPGGGTAAVERGGMVSLLAFWAGGATAGVAPAVDFGLPGWEDDEEGIIQEEDELIMTVIMAFTTTGLME